MTLLLFIACCGVIYSGYRLFVHEDARITDDERAERQEALAW